MSKILAAEYAASIGFNSWGAIKESQVPWPGTVIRVSIAFGILGIVSLWDEQIAEMLGGGFLLASLINEASRQGSNGKWTKTFGAIPPPNGKNWPYFTLGFGKVAP